jgi:DNA-binding CsgD family transcriptional regulator
VVPGQEATIRRVRDHLAALAARQPLVLLLEDLHWADPASLDLLRAVGRGLADLPLLLLATYRDDEPGEPHPLAAVLPALLREARATRLHPPRLTAEHARAIARACYRLAPPDEARLGAHLHAHAAGNPLFLGEILRSLEEEGLLRPAADGAGWALDDLAATRTPPALRRLIGTRVARLGEDAGALLAIAAVIGQEAPLDLWSAVAATGDDALAAVVGPAVAARVLAETPDGQGVRFAHALVRAALYEAIPLPRRRALHRRVAEACLATPGPDPDAVAEHLLRAGDARACDWLVRAGERAERAYAWQAAAARYEAALAALAARGDPGGERGWLLYRLARLRRYDDPAGSIALLDEAARRAADAGDRALAAGALFDLGLRRLTIGDLRRGLAALRAGVAAEEVLTPDEQARLHRRGLLLDAAGPSTSRGTLVLYLAEFGRCAEALALAEGYAAATATLATPREADGDGYVGLGLARTLLGRAGAARQAFAAARIAFRDEEHHFMLGEVASYDLHCALAFAPDDLAGRRRLAAEAEDAYRRASGAGVGPVAHCARLPVLLVEGGWPEAAAHAVALASAAELVGWCRLGARLPGLLARDTGDPAAAWAQVRAALPAGPATAPGDAWFLEATLAQRLAAALALDAGDLGLARAWLAAHDRWLEWSGAVLGRVDGQLGWAAYHRATGDPDAARTHADRALALASEPRQPLALLAAHRALGELDTPAGRHAAAAAHLAAALALAEACAAAYERALTLLALAELRAAEGQRAEAARLADAARAILVPLGASPALARCDALATTRIPVAASAPSGNGPTGTWGAVPPGCATLPRLTPREAEVLGLIAAGRSNREMAEALGRSERTIERHIEGIYRKIGARNRADATAYAFRHGLA